MDNKVTEEDISPGVSVGYSSLIRAALQDENTQLSRINKYWGIVTTPEAKHLVHSSWRHESALGAAWVDDKYLTATTLRANSVAAPQSLAIFSQDDLESAVATLGFPVVVKPRNGSRGRGVTVGVSSFTELEDAYHRARAVSAKVLVEKHIEIAEEFRIMASDRRCYGVVRRLLPSVTGNGTATIRELIEEKNAIRSEHPALRRSLIPIDEQVESTLAEQSLSLSSILPKGKITVVRNVGGLSSGGDSQEYTDFVDSHIKEMAVKAVRSIPGLYWAGVDVVIEARTNSPYVLEINVNAGYSGLEFPSLGEGRTVSPDIWRAVRDKTIKRSEDFKSFISIPVNIKDSSGPKWRTYFKQGLEQRLNSMFQIYLAYRGLRTESLNDGILEVFNDEVLLFRYTRTFRTHDDPAVVNRLMTRYGLARDFLRAAKVPRPTGTRVRNLKQAESDFFESSQKYLVSPLSAPWSPHLRPIRIGEEIANISEDLLPAFVQEWYEGDRIQVLASRERVFSILTANRRRNRSWKQYFEQIESTSLRAVNAVPQMRWALIDLVIPSLPTNEHVVVEGMTIRPLFSARTRPVYGSINAFFEWFFEYSKATARRLPMQSEPQ